MTDAIVETATRTHMIETTQAAVETIAVIGQDHDLDLMMSVDRVIIDLDRLDAIVLETDMAEARTEDQITQAGQVVVLLRDTDGKKQFM